MYRYTVAINATSIVLGGIHAIYLNVWHGEEWGCVSAVRRNPHISAHLRLIIYFPYIFHIFFCIKCT